MKAIVGGAVHTPDRVIPAGVVLVDGSELRAVGTADEVSLPAGTETIDASGHSVAPGLIDVHLHGLLGHDVMGEGLLEVIALLPRFGVTSFMATTITLPHSETVAALGIMDTLLMQPPRGARCIGIHLEGPHLAHSRPGMANPDWLEPLTWDGFATLQAAAGGRVRMVTFAPEIGDAAAVIPRLVDAGVVPVIGHSDATFAQVADAVRLGLRQATHTYNAMRPLGHREPGVVGAVMYFDEIFAQLIADGVHVHPVAMELLLRLKGVDRVVLVSDAGPPAQMPPGEYTWGGGPVIVRDDRCVRADGTIAGSHELLDSGLRRIVRECGRSLAEVLVTATSAPAASVGEAGVGSLEAGARADVVLFDEDLRPALTMVGGDVVWRRS